MDELFSARMPSHAASRASSRGTDAYHGENARLPYAPHSSSMRHVMNVGVLALVSEPRHARRHMRSCRRSVFAILSWLVPLSPVQLASGASLQSPTQRVKTASSHVSNHFPWQFLFLKLWAILWARRVFSLGETTELSNLSGVRWGLRTNVPAKAITSQPVVPLPPDQP